MKSGDPDIQYEAVNTAVNWELDAAWSLIVELLSGADSPKPLLLAAIGAVGSIRLAEAREILVDLADSDDEEIAEIIDEAMAAAKVPTDREDNEEDEWVN